MAADRKPGVDPHDDLQWRGDFRAAEERLLDVSLAATPSERLMWVEEALAFAARMGAVPTERDEK